MPKNHFSVLLMTFTLLCATSANAEVFKWVDVNGMTHYGDSAPQARQGQTIDFKQLRRPSVPASQARETKMSFPSQPRKVIRQSKPTPQRKILRRTTATTSAPKRKVIRRSNLPTQQRQVKRRPTPAQLTRSLSIAILSARESQQEQFREFQLVEKQMVAQEEKPNLDLEEYDLLDMPKSTKKKAVINIKQKLCSEKRMLLAALQEKGFRAYSDEEGHYRLAWGGDGIYQGKRRFLSSKQIANKTKSAMFNIEQYCDAPHNKALQETARANWVRAEYCVVSKAVLEDLEHPFMRVSDKRIDRQVKEVKRLCAKLAPGQHRNDRRYYPIALRPNVTLPRHLTLKEEKIPPATLEQLLALIQ